MKYSLIKPLLFKLSPEFAHNFAILALKNNFLTYSRNNHYPSLRNEICGIDFKNPIGLAAGFDKNAEVFANLFKYGFGFIETGTVTNKAQTGNEKPRIFRLNEDRAIINRLGFNNNGIDVFLKNIESGRKKILSKNDSASKILGINIGKNKDSENSASDYLILLERIYASVCNDFNYITINISSPNTQNLRKLQNKEYLDDFLKLILVRKKKLDKEYKKNIPIFLKIAPDLTRGEQEDIAELSIKHAISGLIISNTTISRPEILQSKFKGEIGGLSGRPLFEISNLVLRNIYNLTKGQIPIIGAGGVFDACGAYQKIKLGASLVQIYTSFIYKGFDNVEKIKKDLNKLLEMDGFRNIREAIGADNF